MSIINFFTPGKNDNWKIIALSIIGATIFWFFNALNKNYNARVSYPLEYTFERDSVIVVNPLAKEVKIDVAGGGWSLFRKTFWFNADPINISLDNPTDIRYYTRSSLVPIISDQLDGLELNYVITDTIFINIEKKVVKKLKVQIDSLGISLKENYRITTPIIAVPDSAFITGPKSIMDKMNLYVWADLDQNNIDENFDDEIKLLLPNDKLVSSNPDEIVVNFGVEKFNTVEMPIKIETLNFPKDSSIYLLDSMVNISYVVSEKDQSSISSTDFNVTVDFSLINKKDSTVSPLLMYAHEKVVEINIPEKIKIQHAN